MIQPLLIFQTSPRYVASVTTFLLATAIEFVCGIFALTFEVFEVFEVFEATLFPLFICVSIAGLASVCQLWFDIDFPVDVIRVHLLFQCFLSRGFRCDSVIFGIGKIKSVIRAIPDL